MPLQITLIADLLFAKGDCSDLCHFFAYGTASMIPAAMYIKLSYFNIADLVSGIVVPEMPKNQEY